MSSVTGNTRVSRILEVILVLTVITGMRYITIPRLFSDGNVLVVPDDPPYHLRRVQLILSNPKVLYKGDPFVDYPTRNRVYWNFGFDGILAGVTGLFYGRHPSVRQTALITSILIPLMAGLVSLLVFFVFRGFSDDRWALFAMLLAGVFFPFFEYSFAGRVDHHVLEPLFALMVVALAQKRPFWAGFSAGISHAFALAAFIPAYALVGMFSIAWVYQDYTKGTLRAADILAGTTIGAGAALAMSPNPFSFVFYSGSLFHCLFPAVAAVAAYGFHLIVRSAPPMSRHAGVARYSALTLVGLGALTGLIPEIRHSMSSAMHLGAGTPMRIALESRSYFRPLQAHHALSLLMAAFTVSGLVRAFSQKHGIVLRLVIIMGILGWVAAAVQRRWLIGFSPFVVMSAVFGMYAVLKWLDGFKAVAPAIAMTAVVMLVSYGFMDLKIQPLSYSGRLAYRVAEFMRTHTPAVDPNKPAYCVLAPWYMGHVIQEYGDRPTVCDNFFGVPGNDRAMDRCNNLFLGTDMQMVQNELVHLKVRYLVLVPPDPRQVRIQLQKQGVADDFVTKNGKFTMAFAHTLLVRLGALNGHAVRLPDGTKLKALRQFRLLRTFKVRDRNGKTQTEASVFEFLPVARSR